jgi:hypothetical protein
VVASAREGALVSTGVLCELVATSETPSWPLPRPALGMHSSAATGAAVPGSRRAAPAPSAPTTTSGGSARHAVTAPCAGAIRSPAGSCGVASPDGLERWTHAGDRASADATPASTAEGWVTGGLHGRSTESASRPSVARRRQGLRAAYGGVDDARPQQTLVVRERYTRIGATSGRLSIGASSRESFDPQQVGPGGALLAPPCP